MVSFVKLTNARGDVLHVNLRNVAYFRFDDDLSEGKAILVNGEHVPIMKADVARISSLMESQT
jgi:hypothetical protein